MRSLRLRTNGGVESSIVRVRLALAPANLDPSAGSEESEVKQASYYIPDRDALAAHYACFTCHS